VAHGQWQAVLQSVSALRAYHWVFRDRLAPARIAELMILRPELPRSLAACYNRVCEVLEAIAMEQGGRRGDPHRMAGEIQARLKFGRIEEIMSAGLHEYLTEMIVSAAELGQAVEAFYIRA
jgi:uncharacterized alpha-E superfamily protein